jgi:hypothetical protein
MYKIFFKVMYQNQSSKLAVSVADPECLSWILIFVHPGPRIPDPRSKNSNIRGGVKKKLSS